MMAKKITKLFKKNLIRELTKKYCKKNICFLYHHKYQIGQKKYWMSIHRNID